MNLNATVKAALAATMSTLVILGLTACGSPNSDTKGGEPGGAVGTQSSSGTEASLVDGIPVEASYTDSDGYSYTFTGTIPKAPFTSDATDAKPGQTNIGIGFGSDPSFLTTIEIKNTTPGRNAPYHFVRLSVRPIYEANSLVCAEVSEYDLIGDNCTSYQLDFYDQTEGDFLPEMIPADGSYKAPLTGSYEPPNPYEGELTVNESDAPAILAAINEPLGWVIYASNTWASFQVNNESETCFRDWGFYWTTPGLDLDVPSCPAPEGSTTPSASPSR